MFDKMTPTQEKRVLRYILAVGFATFLAVWFNWPLAFCAPLFTAKFIVDKPSFHMMHVKQLLFALLSTGVIGLLVSTGLPNYKVPFLLVLSAGLMWGYYLFTDAKWTMFATFLIIELVLIPALTIIDKQAALDVAGGFAFSGTLAVALYALSHVYFPEERSDFQGFPPSPLPDDVRWQASLRALVISFPLLCLFFFFQLSHVLLTVAFVALLAFMTTGEKAKKTTLFFVISNLIGGIVAFIVFFIMSLVPNMYFYMLVMLLVISFFGTFIYVYPEKAPIFATAFTGFTVLMGTSMTTGGLDDKFFARIFQLILVVAYMVFMAYFLESRQQKHTG